MRTASTLLLLFGFRNSSSRNQGERIRYYFTTTTLNAMPSSSSSSSPLSTSPSPQERNQKEQQTKDFSARAEQKWSAAANSYVRYFEPMTVVAGRFLLSLLKLRFQQQQQQQQQDYCCSLKVLEAGCGAGGLAKELLLDASSPSSSLSISELVLTDLSEGMLDRARDTLNPIIINGSSSSSSSSSSSTINKNNSNSGDCIQNVVKVQIEKADFTNFDKQKFPDGYFDRYYTNMCLHYAENPDDVIREASRVLVPSSGDGDGDGDGDGGGIAGFTVWGRRADSPVMTIVPDILKAFKKQHDSSEQQQQQQQQQQQKQQQQKEQKRSPFHLGENDEELRQRFLQDGLFSKCTVMHYPAVLESLDAKDYVETILDGAPSTKKELEEELFERRSNEDPSYGPRQGVGNFEPRRTADFRFSNDRSTKIKQNKTKLNKKIELYSSLSLLLIWKLVLVLFVIVLAFFYSGVDNKDADDDDDDTDL